MKSNPLVSILINNYNYGRFLAAAISSALSQTYSNTEVIVVDDGSTDNSCKIIQSYGNKIIPVLKKNGGQASAFNAGFAASQGEVICFLDSDDIFLPEKAAEVVEALKNRPDLNWCFHALKLVGTNPVNSVGKTRKNLSGEYDLHLHLKTGRLRGKLPAIFPATSGLCFRRSLLQLLLPMPEAKDISISDDYLKFTALALSKGLTLNKELALQRIHENNAFTLRKDKEKVIARISISTAYWIRTKFPFLSKFTHRMLAGGIANGWHAGSIEAECQEIVRKYLSSVTPLEKLEIFSRAFYYRLKP